MTTSAGVPRGPLAVLVAGVAVAHGLLLRDAPPAIDWRHLQGAMTFSVHGLQPPRAAAEPSSPPAASAPASEAAAPPAPPPTATERAVREGPPRAQPPAPATAPVAPTSLPPVPPLPAVRLPGAATWRYEVSALSRGALRSGTAALSWRPAADRYEATLLVTVPGGLARRQASEGALGAHGIEPLRFSDRVRSEEAAHFDRAQGRIVFSSNRPDAALQPGAQDRLSVLLQVAAIVAADPARFVPGASVTLQAATTREAIEWAFTVEGEEQLALPAGPMRALKLTRSPQREYDLRIELWLAPGGDYGPVRLRLTPPNGDWLDMQWSGTDKG